jgi:hypothetical protein
MKTYKRQAKSIELAYLASCMVYLLKKGYHITGIRHPTKGIRFDLIVMDPRAGVFIPVECKFRSGGRKIDASEVEAFAEVLRQVFPERHTAHGHYYDAMFVTNTRFSEGALRLAKDRKIKPVAKVPLLFYLKNNT